MELVCICVMANDFEHLFICLFSICKFLGKMPLSVAHFIVESFIVYCEIYILYIYMYLLFIFDCVESSLLHGPLSGCGE